MRRVLKRVPSNHFWTPFGAFFNILKRNLESKVTVHHIFQHMRSHFHYPLLLLVPVETTKPDLTFQYLRDVKNLE
jgi:hypothetical protein